MTERARQVVVAVVALAAVLALGWPALHALRVHVRAWRYDPATGFLPPEPALLVGSMELTLKSGKVWRAGTGSLVRHGGRTLILTAAHLFGPAGGLPSQLSPAELAAQVGRAAFKDSLTGRVWESSQPLEIAAAQVGGGGMDGAAHDEAAFVVPGPPMGRELSDEIPPVGARLTLAFGDDVYGATVRDSSPTHLVYTYDHGSAGRGSSGSPVIDAQGRVVGVHVSLCSWQGEPCGNANPSVSIRRDLDGPPAQP